MSKNSDNKEPKEIKGKSSTKRRPAISIGIAAGIIVVLAITGIAIFKTAYADKVLPRTKIADTYVGGLIEQQVADIVQEYADQLAVDGISYNYGGRQVTLQPTVSAADDPDLTYELFTVDPETTTSNALGIGHQQSFVNDIKDHVLALVSGHEVVVAYSIDSQAVYDYLKENYQEVDKPATNADFEYNNEVFTVTGENSGQVIDYEKAIFDLSSRIRNLSLESINLELIMEEPTVSYSDAQQLLDEAQGIVQQAPLTLRAEEEVSWEVNKETFGRWLTVRSDNQQTTLALKTNLVSEFLQDKKTEYDIEMKEGKLELANGKVTEFQPSQTGREIVIDESINNIEIEVIKNGSNESLLAIAINDPVQQTGDVNDLGINEIIGVGESDFSGSPTNRRKNIALGAAMLHGQLIKPDEDFSLVAALGRFDPADGWLPELVIKGNKTIPEIGGGACQFGTTMFRGALDTGLPITARRNHSYTVSYYYPIGTDATIYDPAPDMRFKNDTGHHILLQTRIEGNKLIFEFWGTNDGRVTTQTKPVLTNWTEPPPRKEVETTDLPPGEVKCTERAHSGVTASFNYSVTYADGTALNNTFSSRYKPWQEVCLVGVAPESAAEAD
ncbi:VanW family protein [Patescibacteria group bacterium]